MGKKERSRCVLEVWKIEVKRKEKMCGSEEVRECVEVV
jgi:hypothetical protein